MASSAHAHHDDETFGDDHGPTGNVHDSVGASSLQGVSRSLRNRSRWVDSFTPTGRPSTSFGDTMREEEEGHQIEMARAIRRMELAQLDLARVGLRISILLMWLAFLAAVVSDIVGTATLCTQLTFVPTPARLVIGLGSGFVLPVGAATLTSRWARRRWLRAARPVTRHS